ncbi:MotA/TolQ/ExbB proton channel [Cystobacter fuscus DSM 2262]|uniref:MotA/TolQ/ExbB proton channel n=1 Tax=Cystobacter fuscus (strain ATCC 25194 / DSM 2262 / NBRC 100088 / M29) TaxID=1242864 RepID=S9PEA4_CYSF2|nr:MotA/TolQ/ExbB proton channel family protein [Cystobacter fuscus]EPX60652.1 MotA/TolQ/ExbB proton channel [Cystobacter fuscus DSM 2262]
MHFIIGMLGLGLTLAYTLTQGHASGFGGIIHVPSLVLLGFAPLCMTVASYKFSELGGAARAVGRALRFSASRSRAQLYEALTQFAAEVRQRRPARALEIASQAQHDVLRQLGPLVIRQYSAADIESTASTSLFCMVSGMKRAEDVLGTLSRVAPATGLVGTVLGLISLLKDLSRFEQLGPSMALALLCTLYGLLLANAVYQPLARIIHSHMTVAVEEARLITRALVLIREDKPLADVRKLFELSGTSPHGAGAPAAEIATGTAGEP